MNASPCLVYNGCWLSNFWPPPAEAMIRFSILVKTAKGLSPRMTMYDFPVIFRAFSRRDVIVAVMRARRNLLIVCAARSVQRACYPKCIKELTASYEDTGETKIIFWMTKARLVVLLEESVLESEASNGATSQSGKEVDPNLSIALHGRARLMTPTQRKQYLVKRTEHKCRSEGARGVE